MVVVNIKQTIIKLELNQNKHCENQALEQLVLHSLLLPMGPRTCHNQPG